MFKDSVFISKKTQH